MTSPTHLPHRTAGSNRPLPGGDTNGVVALRNPHVAEVGEFPIDIPGLHDLACHIGNPLNNAPPSCGPPTRESRSRAAEFSGAHRKGNRSFGIVSSRRSTNRFNLGTDFDPNTMEIFNVKCHR